MNMITVALKVVIFEDEVFSLQPIIVGGSSLDATHPSEAKLVDIDNSKIAISYFGSIGRNHFIDDSLHGGFLF